MKYATRLTPLIASVLMMATACTTVAANVPVRGDPSSISKLVGNWEGTYSSDVTGRSGIITFNLRTATDTAQGDVIMIPRTDRGQANVPQDEANRHLSQPAAVLTIRFVRATDNQLLGVLDPYTDPDCGCLLTTRFFGRMNGDEINGTFTSTGSGISHGTTRGTWSVQRKVSASPSARGELQ